MPRKHPEDERLVQVRTKAWADVGKLLKELRKDRGLTLRALGDRMKQVGALHYQRRPEVLADIEAGHRGIAIEDVVMLAQALSRPNDRVSPLQLTPWAGSTDSAELVKLEIRLMTERVRMRQAKIREVAAQFTELFESQEFRAAIEDLAALSKDDRQVMARALRGLRGGGVRKPAVELDMRDVGEPPLPEADINSVAPAPHGDVVVPGSPRSVEGLAAEPSEAVDQRSDLPVEIDWSTEAPRWRKTAEYAEEHARIQSGARARKSKGGSKKS